MTNKRLRSRRNAAKDELLAGLDLPVPKKTQNLSRRASHVSEEIHRLECVIAAAPTLKRQRQLRRRDVLPPLELEASAPRRPRQAAILPQHARRLRRQQRFYQAVKLLLILLGIAAMAGWMKNWQS